MVNKFISVDMQRVSLITAEFHLRLLGNKKEIRFKVSRLRLSIELTDVRIEF